MKIKLGKLVNEDIRNILLYHIYNNYLFYFVDSSITHYMLSYTKYSVRNSAYNDMWDSVRIFILRSM